MASSTSVELHTLQESRLNRQESLREAPSHVLDPILQASRINDSNVPEGGYSWTVVISCAVVAWWAIGTHYAWGVTQSALRVLISATAIVNSRLMRRLGPQKIGMAGVTLIALSEICSSFAFKNVGALFVTNGVMMGLGCSLCFTTCSVAPAQYFSRKRGLANGIVFAGGGLGGAANSFALDLLIRKLGTSWAYRIIAAMTIVTGLPAAYLIKQRVPYTGSGFVEWRLFKSMTFVLVFFAGALGTFPLFVPPFFIPLYAKSIGLSSSTGAGLLAGFNFSSAVGRIGCGILCDKLGPLNTLFLSLILTGFSMLALWPVSTTLAPLAAFVILNGISNGGFFSTMPTVVGNVFGSAEAGNR